MGSTGDMHCMRYGKGSLGSVLFRVEYDIDKVVDEAVGASCCSRRGIKCNVLRGSERTSSGSSFGEGTVVLSGLCSVVVSQSGTSTISFAR